MITTFRIRLKQYFKFKKKNFGFFWNFFSIVRNFATILIFFEIESINNNLHIFPRRSQSTDPFLTAGYDIADGRTQPTISGHLPTLSTSWIWAVLAHVSCCGYWTKSPCLILPPTRLPPTSHRSPTRRN